MLWKSTFFSCGSVNSINLINFTKKKYKKKNHQIIKSEIHLKIINKRKNVRELTYLGCYLYFRAEHFQNVSLI